MRSSLAPFIAEPPLPPAEIDRRKRRALEHGIAVIDLGRVVDERRRREIEDEAERQMRRSGA